MLEVKATCKRKSSQLYMSAVIITVTVITENNKQHNVIAKVKYSKV